MEIGTGWLGWTEQQTLATRIPAIELAYRGRRDMLRAIFGGSDDEPEPQPVEADKVREVFARFKI